MPHSQQLRPFRCKLISYVQSRFARVGHMDLRIEAETRDMQCLYSCGGQSGYPKGLRVSVGISLSIKCFTSRNPSGATSLASLHQHDSAYPRKRYPSPLFVVASS